MTGKEAIQELEKYKRAYKSVIEVNKRFELKIIDLESKLRIAEINLKNAQNAADINKTILRQTTEDHNKKESELIQLMTKMKVKLRGLGFNGNFDNLGN